MTALTQLDGWYIVTSLLALLLVLGARIWLEGYPPEDMEDPA